MHSSKLRAYIVCTPDQAAKCESSECQDLNKFITNIQHYMEPSICFDVQDMRCRHSFSTFSTSIRFEGEESERCREDKREKLRI